MSLRKSVRMKDNSKGNARPEVKDITSKQHKIRTSGDNIFQKSEIR